MKAIVPSRNDRLCANDSDRLVADIRTTRDRLGELVGELERRGHQTFDLRRQLRRHPLPAAVALAAVAGGVAGTIWMVVAHRRQRRRLLPRLQRLRLAATRLVRDPEHVAPARPKVAARLATTGAEVALGVIVRALARRLLGPLGLSSPPARRQQPT